MKSTLPVPGISRRTFLHRSAGMLASFAAAPTVYASAPETGAESVKPKPKAGTVPVEFGYRPKGMTMTEDGSYHGKSRTGWQVADLGFGAADMEVEATGTLKSGVAAGLVLRGNRSAPHPKGDFVFALDVQDGCVFAASLSMFSPMNRRQFKAEPNRAYHLRLCTRGNRYQLYVDGELILHGSFPKDLVRAQPGLGLFVDRGGTVIEKLAVHQQAPSP